MTEMDQDSRPWSEKFRIVAKKWVEADAAARMLEECKSATLSQRKKEYGGMPDTHAEREVKASPAWMEYLIKMVEARTQANLTKVQLEYIRMKFSEETNKDANARHELRLGR